MDFPNLNPPPTDDSGCEDTLVVAVGQAATIIITFQVMHLLVRRLGQPRVVSEILSGVVVGSVASKIWPLEGLFKGEGQITALQGVSMIARIFYMFLLGLELDPRYLWQNKYKASLITFGTLFFSAIFGTAFSHLGQRTIHGEMPLPLFTVLFIIIIAGTSAPTVARTAAELKIATFDIGRLAITSSILSDIVVLLLMSFKLTSGQIDVVASTGFLGTIIMSVYLAIYIVRPTLRRLDRINRRGEVTNLQFGGIVTILILLAFVEQVSSFNDTFLAFMVGLVFPKTGKMARSVMGRLHGLVHEILLPLLFAYGSLAADITQMEGANDVKMLFLIVALSLVSKVIGSLAACWFLGIPLMQSLVMGFLLNVKGQVDLIILYQTLQQGKWEGQLYVVALVSAIINTMITPPVVTAIVRYERRHVTGYKPVGLEELPPEMELRMLACTHNIRSLPALLSLIEGTRGPFGVPTAIYLMHLIELTEETSASLLRVNEESSLHRAPSQAESVSIIGDENADYDDTTAVVEDHRQMEITLYTFRQATGITVRQVKAISMFHNMHEDICNGADDLRASVIILPFHKYQRVDGGMETIKSGHGEVNCKVIQHARCTVGILIDRGLGQVNQTTPEVLYQVGALFFGGRDDREALAYGARMSEHPGVSLTVIRFRPTNVHEYQKAVEIHSARERQVLTKISEHERERAADEAYMSMFYTRYVVTGTVTYLEKYVANGSETVAALGDLRGLYTLLLVGKGPKEMTPLTSGMSDWEDCPELGHIGDLLASSDFGYPGSVLVIQQSKSSNVEDLDDDCFA